MADVLHFYLRDRGSVLASRRRGREAAAHLRQLREEPSDLILDFKDVEAVTPPFLQELLDAVQSSINQADRGRLVVAANLNDDVAETLALVLERRKQTLAFRRGTKVELLKPEQHLVETLREAQSLKRFTAGDLATRLDINPTAAHQRLQPLLAAGVVARDFGLTAKGRRSRVFRAASRDMPHFSEPPRQAAATRREPATT